MTADVQQLALEKALMVVEAARARLEKAQRENSAEVEALDGVEVPCL